MPLDDQSIWGAMIGGLATALGGAGLWLRAKARNGKPVEVQLDQESRDRLKNIEHHMKEHNADSQRIIDKLDDILLRQAEDRGRHGQ